jgi:hypothetical protein
MGDPWYKFSRKECVGEMSTRERKKNEKYQEMFQRHCIIVTGRKCHK